MTELKEILEALAAGKLEIAAAEEQIETTLQRAFYIENIENMTKFDVFRQERTGLPEVIFSESKTTEQLVSILKALLKTNEIVLFSRVRPDQYAPLNEVMQDKTDFLIENHKDARMIVVKKKTYIPPTYHGKIGILCAGTSDLPVAETARIMVEAMGIETIASADVGVAGLHRLFPPLKKMLLEGVSCIIVVAGMEGTLPGIVASLVDLPVIGVPTSVGYGLHGNGISALTTMLQSCSPGLTVVNIDNGFGAAAAAILVVSQIEKVYREQEKTEKTP